MTLDGVDYPTVVSGNTAGWTFVLFEKKHHPLIGHYFCWGTTPVWVMVFYPLDPKTGEGDWTVYQPGGPPGQEPFLGKWKP